jgi:hypothetical protein
MSAGPTVTRIPTRPVKSLRTAVGVKDETNDVGEAVGTVVVVVVVVDGPVVDVVDVVVLGLGGLACAVPIGSTAASATVATAILATNRPYMGIVLLVAELPGEISLMWCSDGVSAGPRPSMRRAIENEPCDPQRLLARPRATLRAESVAMG